MVPRWLLWVSLICLAVNPANLTDQKTSPSKVCKTAKKLGFCQDGICIKTLFGLKCNCPSGFLISKDGNQCTDIDECSVKKPCSQLEQCQNTKGSYRCFCKGGYERNLDGKCQVSDFIFLEAEQILNSQSDEGFTSGDDDVDDEGNDNVIAAIYGSGGEELSGGTEYPSLPTETTVKTLKKISLNYGPSDEDFSTEIKTTPSSVLDSCSLLSCSKGSRCIHDNSQTVRCQCPLGKSGKLCEKDIHVKIPRFDEHSYMKLAKMTESSKAKFKLVLEINPSDDSGLILYSGDSLKGDNDFFSLGLTKGKLQFRFNCGTGLGVLESQTKIPLNSWSLITVYRFHRSASLNINNTLSITGKSIGKYTLISFTEYLYLGGLPEYSILSQDVGFLKGFEGYVRTLHVNQDKYPLHSYSSKIVESFDVGV